MCVQILNYLLLAVAQAFDQNIPTRRLVPAIEIDLAYGFAELEEFL
jgi:hypothetical protein